MKSTFLRKAAVLALVVTAATSLNEAPHELYMKSDVIKYFGKYYNSLKLYLGTGNETAKASNHFQISFGRSNTLLGDKQLAGWGVDCGSDEPDPQSTCVFNSVG